MCDYACAFQQWQQQQQQQQQVRRETPYTSEIFQCVSTPAEKKQTPVLLLGDTPAHTLQLQQQERGVSLVLGSGLCVQYDRAVAGFLLRELYEYLQDYLSHHQHHPQQSHQPRSRSTAPADTSSIPSTSSNNYNASSVSWGGGVTVGAQQHMQLTFGLHISIQ